ncbi:hypothetical protein K466DRAFT_326601 [Polyporus arcularius HHB13444]|uniref:Uncharacterized protein n=1 Tax=Polyporus arcularius HHB13444 TaxID=1314778 RepID=A0A5C3PXU7_9APHY|nr:hypothetical protein K466DRAFT_326601 [Polyporus arcularius HHB13444]
MGRRRVSVYVTNVSKEGMDDTRTQPYCSLPVRISRAPSQHGERERKMRREEYSTVTTVATTNHGRAEGWGCR